MSINSIQKNVYHSFFISNGENQYLYSIISLNVGDQCHSNWNPEKWRFYNIGTSTSNKKLEAYSYCLLVWGGGKDEVLEQLGSLSNSNFIAFKNELGVSHYLQKTVFHSSPENNNNYRFIFPTFSIVQKCSFQSYIWT